SGGPYVSEAYQTQAVGHAYVVAVAAPVYGTAGRLVGILVAAYSLEHIQLLTDELSAAANDIELEVTDQHGFLLAGPNGSGTGLVSHRSEPDVAAALAGRSGVLELHAPG